MENDFRLLNALRDNNITEVKELLKTAKVTDRELFFCVQWQTPDILKLLLDTGVDVNMRQERFQSNATSLHYAVKRGDLEIIKLLLDYGADTALLDSHGCLPIEVTPKIKLREKLIELKPFLESISYKAEQFVRELDDKGYFKYVSDRYLSDAKYQLKQNYIKYSFVIDPMQPLDQSNIDSRIFPLDLSNATSNRKNIHQTLELMESLIMKLGLNINEVKSDINGLLKDDMDCVDSAKVLLSVFNVHLEKNNSKEMLYILKYSSLVKPENKIILLTVSQLDTIKNYCATYYNNFGNIPTGLAQLGPNILYAKYGREKIKDLQINSTIDQINKGK